MKSPSVKIDADEKAWLTPSPDAGRAGPGARTDLLSPDPSAAMGLPGIDGKRHAVFLNGALYFQLPRQLSKQS